MLYDEAKPYAIQVRQRGQVTIPRTLRELLSIEDGDTLTMLAIGDTLVLAPRALRVPEMADRLTELLEQSGLSLADVLEDLPRIREALYKERYETGRAG